MLNRRSTLTLLSGALVAPGTVLADTPKTVQWDDLIPPGVPYSEIIGEGIIDAINDTWNPVYDENATKLNEALDGAYIRMPGYVIPLDFSAEGVSEFILVPYQGACIHVPPPPANQLVIVTSHASWSPRELWEAVWVTGTMRTEIQSTDLGDTGYTLTADEVEIFKW